MASGKSHLEHRRKHGLLSKTQRQLAEAASARQQRSQRLVDDEHTIRLFRRDAWFRRTKATFIQSLAPIAQ